MDKVIVVIFSIVALIISFMVWTFLTSPIGYTTEQIVSMKYCDAKGHETILWGSGLYNKYENENYGRVICGDCYIEGCRWKEYNVTISGPGGYLSKLNDAYRDK